eukprot:TRINITY_DN3152_c0_g2_i1.p1 TRINITY_DN3152_c0_g2~~TRINITY_DN3152_c0_g2_i1.p1  ORF type:complete len:424 (+),score=143.04 TRINITY_DN3152_c0_g2_i1:68-1339(+)
MVRLSLVLVALFGLLATVQAGFSTGYVHSENGFAYLSKFCFDFTPPESPDPAGEMHVKLLLDPHVRVPPPDMNLLIYDDQDFSWPAVYNKPLSCSEKRSKALLSVPVVFQNGVFEHRGIVFEHLRPRFWYVVLANCQRIYGVTYQVTFENSVASGWSKQFGVNEQGLNTLYLVYFLVVAALVAVHGYGLRPLWSNGLPPIHRLFTAGLCILWLAIALELFHLFVYMANGFGSPLMHGFSQLLRVVSQLCMLFLLLLLSTGWCISTENITHRSRIITTFLALSASYLLLLLWAAGRDPASTLYVYDSFPGACIVALNVAALAMFLSWLRESHDAENDPEKKAFYWRLGVSYGWWFASLLVVVLIAGILSPWVREKVVTTIQLTVDVVAYAGMVFLLWPSRANNNFKISTPNISEEYDSLINETM